MKRLSAAIAAAVLLGAPTGALAGNPSGTGPPSQSCQEIEEVFGGHVPGRSSSSPGSPFNEPELNSEKGGVGGQHYAEGSQYDVACYQVSRH
jgi:hypothetical protein